MAALLVLDEQLENRRLVQALRDRGIECRTVGDFGVQGRADPDVVRRIADQVVGSWVLVTMDLSIVEEHARFDWSRYAIAWVRIRKELKGVRAEEAKANTIHRHAHLIQEQGRGDHYTYWPKRHEKHPPSLASMTEKQI